MALINVAQTTTSEIVVTERVTTSEFYIRSITESIEARFVRVEVELGQGQLVSGTPLRGQRRSITVWKEAEYDAVRDTWTNADLLAAVTLKVHTNTAPDMVPPSQ